MNENEQETQADPLNGDDVQIDTRGSRVTFFESAEVDALMTALLETMSQLWATRGHVRILEQLLVSKGLMTSEELQQFDLPEFEKEKDQQSLQAFFADAFRAMGATTQSIDGRQKEVDRFQNYKAAEKNS